MIRMQGIQEISTRNQTGNRNAGVRSAASVERTGGRLSPYPYSVYPRESSARRTGVAV